MSFVPFFLLSQDLANNYTWHLVVTSLIFNLEQLPSLTTIIFIIFYNNDILKSSWHKIGKEWLW